MIFGRPTNLWLGFATAFTGFVGLVSISIGHPIDAALLAGAVTFEGAAILLIANTPPTLAPGDTYHVATPPGQPNGITRVVTRTGDARQTDTAPVAADVPPDVPPDVAS